MNVLAGSRTSLLAAALTCAAFSQDFGPQSLTLDAFPSGFSSALADFDGDGDQDIVAVGTARATAVWLENVGGGRYLGQRELGPDAVRSEKYDVKAVDLDGDGDPDVLFSGRAPQKVGWYENLGSGQFAEPRAISQAGGQLNDVQAIDVDSDGFLDPVVNVQGTLVWFPNLGGGNFAAQEAIVPSPGASTGFDGVDLDQDGDQDIVFTNANQNQIKWIEQTSPGVWASPALLSTSISSPSRPQVVDVDGDGLLDLVAVNESADVVVWLQGLGALMFSTPQLVFAPSHGTVAEYRMGDFDGDGSVDVVGLGSDTEAYQWSRNLGGDFSQPQGIGEETLMRELKIVDLDGDGDLDILATEEARLLAFRWEAGGFDAATQLGVATNLAPIFETPDLDGDGLADLVMAGELGDRNYTWYRNSGGGTWSTPGESFSMREPQQVKGVDIDADGDLDLVASGGSYDAARAWVHWVENLGGGMLGAPRTLHSDLADSGATFELGDFDGDGDWDLLWSHEKFIGSLTTRFEWIEQTAPGVFAPGPVLPDNLLQNSFRLGQVNGDAFADAFQIRFQTGQNRLTWRAGDGGGQLGPEMIIRDAASPRIAEARVADMDGDGHDDVVVFGDNGVDLHLWQPTLSAFGPSTSIDSVGAWLIGGVLRDVNRDGRIDVFISSTGVAARWSENLGGGLFGPVQPLPEVDPGSRVLALGDVDGDLDLDVLKLTSIEGLAWNTNLARFGEGYCGPAALNSSGAYGAMSAAGSKVIADNDVVLVAERLPALTFGFFLVAPGDGFVVAAGGSQGNLCLGGRIGRLNRGPAEIFRTNTSGEASRTLNVLDVPTPTGSEALLPGDTRYFQAWFRDAQPTVTSNFTAGLRIQFE
ncbi:FG-GAP repeat protein [Planctomycetes bacterium Poly30]|uniref:FG-GAP repeat protein n=1 Tax=Saltatorellus ferox TaxID=2528018 RepID=A0A518EV81_9BACT|nr:FG-GAP repeat protein [Planctomycetes bacterium Poly30]